MPRVLCLYMPWLPADRARRELEASPERWAQPTLPHSGATGDGVPLALTRRSGSAVFVAHCCARARAAGVRAGMTLAQAQAIAPRLRALEDDPARDREMLRRLAAWATRFSPVVEPVEPNTLLLNITGCAAVFGGGAGLGAGSGPGGGAGPNGGTRASGSVGPGDGPGAGAFGSSDSRTVQDVLATGEARIGRLALDDLAAMGIAARAAIADTVGGACALATGGDEYGMTTAGGGYGKATGSAHSTTSVVGSDGRGQGGPTLRNDVLVVVPPGQTVAWIAKLPPAALRIEAEAAERLWSLGVRSIGDLLSLPRGGLAARFGAGLLRRLQQALGERPEPITAYRDDPPACARIAFDGPLRDLPTLQTAVRGLLGGVLEDLIRRDESPRRLDLLIQFERPMEWECSIRDEDGRRHTTPPAHISVGLSRASRSARHLGDLLANRIEKVDLSAGVCGVTLTAVQTSPWRAVTGNLFEAATGWLGPPNTTTKPRPSPNPSLPGRGVLMDVSGAASGSRSASSMDDSCGGSSAGGSAESSCAAMRRSSEPQTEVRGPGCRTRSPAIEAAAQPDPLTSVRGSDRPPCVRTRSLSPNVGETETFAEMIDRIANRLGHGAVLRPMLVDDHQPEMAFRYVPVSEAGLEVNSECRIANNELNTAPSDGDSATTENRKSKIENLPASALRYSLFDIRYSPRYSLFDIRHSRPARPLRLLVPPAAVRVMAVVPNGPPVRLVWHGREYDIVHASGPERIETAWWRGADVRRDYFRVCTNSGEQFWVFRALNENRWYVHGVFA